MQRSEGYSPAQRAVHWLMAAMILAMIPVGIAMTNAWSAGAFPPARGTLYELHKTFGVLVFALACIRVAVRVVAGAPGPAETLTPGQRRASAAVHHLLYLLIFVVPLTGWLGTSACCAPVNLFWTVPVTLPVSGGPDFAKLMFRLHFVSAILMTVLVVGHIGAALWHRLVLRDGVFARMGR